MEFLEKHIDIMYYLMVKFTYTTTDFYADRERTRNDYVLNFYNTYEECELQYKNIKENLLKEYNCIGKEAYKVGGEYFVELD